MTARADDDLKTGRRGFLGVMSAVAVFSGLTGISQAQLEVKDEKFTGDFAILKGARDDRPTSEGQNRLVYLADDTQEIFITVWNDDQWELFGDLGQDGGTDSRVDISEDGALQQADASDLNFTDGFDVSEGPEVDGVSVETWDLDGETDTVTVNGSGTERVSFTNTYQFATNSVGVQDVAASNILNADVYFNGWVRNGDGNITGMDILFNDQTLGSMDILWDVFGALA